MIPTQATRYPPGEANTHENKGKTVTEIAPGVNEAGAAWLVFKFWPGQVDKENMTTPLREEHAT
jgi:hypothetical protein